MPQVTRSIKTADTVIAQLSGPVERIAPGLSRLAETLGSPVFVNLPREIAGFIDTIGDLALRMQPLTQMAETAGSLFGLRPLAALRGGAPKPAPEPEPTKPAATTPAKKATAKKATPKQTTAKQTAAKKATAKKAGAKTR
jgi:hypothetical protein